MHRMSERDGVLEGPDLGFSQASLYRRSLPGRNAVDAKRQRAILLVVLGQLQAQLCGGGEIEGLDVSTQGRQGRVSVGTLIAERDVHDLDFIAHGAPESSVIGNPAHGK